MLSRLSPLAIVSAGVAVLGVVSIAMADSTFVGGTVIIDIVAANKSGIPTNSAVLCKGELSLGPLAPVQALSQRVVAKITPTSVSCTIRIPYITTKFNGNTYGISFVAKIDNFGSGISAEKVMANSLSMLTYSSIELSGFNYGIPENGATITETIKAVI